MNSTDQYVLPAKKSHFYWVIAFIAAFAGILFGYDTGVISGAILFISQEFHLSPQMNGFVVSAVLIGAFLGALFSGHLADYIGRKRLLIIDALIFIVGTAISSMTVSISWLVIGRIIVGIAIGIASYSAPLYISEISPPHRRGALVSLNQLAVTIGIFLSYVVDYYFARHDAWRSMFAAGVIPAALLLLGMIVLPYSPRWIFSRGHEEKALWILRKLRGHGPHAEQELEHIRASLQQQKGDWRTLFPKIIRPTLFIAIGLAVFQQVTGINTVLYYAPTILKMTGFQASQTAILATMGIGAVLVIITIISLPLIDSLGRRPLLFIGVGAMTVSLLVLSWSFKVHGHMDYMRWIAFGSLLVFISGFSISLGPIMWLMFSEIFPLRVRGLGASIGACTNWASNWLVTITFLTLIEYLGPSGTFFIYFIISVITLIFIYTSVPETKGVTLEQIEENLYAGKDMRYLGK
ncbi:sugar porter family MFS transporter [Coxiella burnetii]|uniref:sugar porter family MFS transporter n=1 Tax=Coxiella burnetii TaxID=777 RepID=UPI0000ED000E|nr:sugar porter family MFS transporter [Coxiella burnetii]EAX33375.1 MFS transporter [Coxiella burnetii 'MSU Goat Q177']UYK70032.1 sugar porter family MFS transporter [Coxiella burnetii]